MPDIRIPALDTPFVFQRRPASIPADLRPGWRIGVVLLLLRKCCRGNKTSFGRLHVLSWGVRTKESRLALTRTVNGNMPWDALMVRIEPSLNRAVDYALGEGLLQRLSRDRLRLTTAGVSLVGEIDQHSEMYVTEKQFTAAIGYRVTETLVSQLFGRGSTS